MQRLLALLLALASPLLQAADKTATIALNVEVLPACQAGTTSASGLSFGTLDFGTHLRLDNLITRVGQPGAGALRVNCQQNIPYRVLINGGHSGSTNNRQMAGPGSAVLTYNLYTGADYTTVWDDSTGVSAVGNGQDQWLPVYARVPAQGTPPPGSYSDTLTITVSW
ncbi:spore coat U domain-containing protein [Pseudomonas sp. Marseille-Q0931]|jgi:spore coat protein U-like protein|uniref:Csu type fimbrial protein n=1 Tax=Pseudomonas sp. Marseille-Q0931 TaxID=2697507 RepID=UPI0023B891B8|nr:spore coat U domain-containing protein [Pseudomonas sp. Marseille-Q0931]